MKDAVTRLGLWKGIWFMGIFRWQPWQAGRFFNWGKPAGLPYQTSVTLDPIGEMSVGHKKRGLIYLDFVEFIGISRLDLP